MGQQIRKVNKKIKQVYTGKDYATAVNNDTDIDDILNDLGYTANDFMNVSFVFIVEGKQDKSRLPLVIDNIENIRIYVGGHNLYDIFYGRFKHNENEILTRYIEEAPRSIFEDIIDKIDDFVYFTSRKI